MYHSHCITYSLPTSTAHTVASSVAFTSNDFSPFSSKLDSIVSAALVVLRFYVLYILAEVVIFYAALLMSRLSSLDYSQINGRYLPLRKEYIYNQKNVKRFPIFIKKSIIYLYKLWENAIFNFYPVFSLIRGKTRWTFTNVKQTFVSIQKITLHQLYFLLL